MVCLDDTSTIFIIKASTCPGDDEELLVRVNVLAIESSAVTMLLEHMCRGLFVIKHFMIASHKVVKLLISRDLPAIKVAVLARAAEFIFRELIVELFVVAANKVEKLLIRLNALAEVAPADAFLSLHEVEKFIIELLMITNNEVEKLLIGLDKFAKEVSLQACNFALGIGTLVIKLLIVRAHESKKLFVEVDLLAVIVPTGVLGGVAKVDLSKRRDADFGRKWFD
jgi:hypothetical protein